MPVLVVASEDDPDGGGATTRGFLQACACPGKQLIVVPGVVHGLGLLVGTNGPTVHAAVLAFTDKHSGPA